MTTPIPIATFEDILAAMENNPGLQAAMRQHVLDQEFLQLPAIVRELQQAVAELAELVRDYIATTNERLDRLEQDVKELKADVATLKVDMTQVKTDVTTLKTDVATLKTDVATLKTDVATLKTDVATLKTDVAELKGHTVPVAVQRMTGALTQAVNVRRPRWLDSTQIVDIADDAEDEGRAAIPANELESFKAIDLAMTAVDKATREPCYVVIECSYTLANDDVIRVKRNAEHMTRFTGIPARAVAAGNFIPDVVSRFAESNDVTCVPITNKATSPR